MEKYGFGYSSEDAFSVEIPEMDAFIGEIKAVCAKHGVGFDLERGYSDDSSTDFLIVPYEKANFDFFTEDLDDYNGGVPWLDDAKKEWDRRRSAHYEAQRAAEAANRTRAAAAKKAQQEALEADAIRNGLILGGKKYKLVAD